MNLLPLELIHLIVAYDGRIKYRNGKYINQIAPDDNRYKMLQQMPQIQPYYYLSWYMIISDSQNKICCEKRIPSYIYSIWYHCKKTFLIHTESNTDRVRYTCISQGSYYQITIYKTQRTFIESVLQFFSFIKPIFQII